MLTQFIANARRWTRKSTFNAEGCNRRPA